MSLMIINDIFCIGKRNCRYVSKYNVNFSSKKKKVY